MPKSLPLLFSILLPLSAVAQSEVYAPHSWENISLTLAGGVHHPLGYKPNQQLMKASASLSLNKQLTPIWGLSLEADVLEGDQMLYDTRFSRSTLSVVGRWNLSNAFGGYYERPRWYETIVRTGVGWGHSFSDVSSERNRDYFVAKVGAEFNFNLGRSRAVTIGLRPELMYRILSDGAQQWAKFNLDHADLRLLVGVTYHFGNGHGGRHPAPVAPAMIYRQSTQPAIDKHRPQLESERQQLINERDAYKHTAENLQKTLSQQQTYIAQLQQRLSTAGLPVQSPPAVPSTTTTKRLLESVITFAVGSTAVAPAQYPNVERVATYLRRNPRAYVVVKGYASPDGSPQVNARVARRRAETVKSLLIAQYGIRQDRIRVQGEGVGHLFSDPDWNRVAICTIVE